VIEPGGAAPLPDPALVVLVGASGSGKSTWAQGRYRPQEIASSDDLRGVVGSGRHDLDASADAFALLDAIVAARLRRGLTCVVDTLGLDADRRRGFLAAAQAHRLPAIAVVFDVADQLARERNRLRDRPVPADVLTSQLRRSARITEELDGEGWDRVVRVRSDEAPDAAPAGRPDRAPEPERGLDFVLQLSRFTWGDGDPAEWLRGMALAAEEAGFAGLALMDHLIQIPQVDRAWAPILEPWVTLGLLAGLDTRLRLGTLVSPVTFRPAGITAKTVATLDVLSGGRAFLGIGAGWWDREHAAFGLPFPAAGARLDLLRSAIETIRALWSPGTKAHAGDRVSLPETTCYPRPVSGVPIIVGGSGARTLRIAAELADGCNVSSDDVTLDRSIATLRSHCADLGRGPDEVALTVLDLPVAGADRDEVWSRVEALRGRTAAATFARTHHAGTYAEQRERFAQLAERGVRTVFLAPPHVRTPAGVLALAPMLAR
jgi:alkanesulfonate monooxygenase SsuD/methylene tetrahydromethanopterin reductase-like flavin-dependent oxidoreductase (luciferase family)/predicted kinase